MGGFLETGETSIIHMHQYELVLVGFFLCIMHSNRAADNAVAIDMVAM